MLSSAIIPSITTKPDERGHIRVYAPPYPAFNDAVLALGGQPVPAALDGRRGYSFLPALEGRLRDLCREHFGTDGDDSPELCTVRVDGTKFSPLDTWYLLGRELARRPKRTWEVILAEGVRVAGGGFQKMGGSTKFPKVTPQATCWLHVLDVPRGLAERVARALPETVTIVDGPGDPLEVAAHEEPSRPSDEAPATVGREAVLAAVQAAWSDARARSHGNPFTALEAVLHHLGMGDEVVVVDGRRTLRSLAGK